LFLLSGSDSLLGKSYVDRGILKADYYDVEGFVRPGQKQLLAFFLNKNDSGLAEQIPEESVGT
jgi:hypothetical protein